MFSTCHPRRVADPRLEHSLSTRAAGVSQSIFAAEVMVGHQPTEGPMNYPEAEMHILEVETIIEHELAETVQRHYPLDWSEDAITHDFMIRLRQYFRKIEIRGLSIPIHVEWEVYKLRGKAEQTYGDIGVLVRYRLHSGVDVEGAGFLEAKARERNSARFPSVRHEQVQRLLRRSPHTRLLLYDHRPVPVLDSYTPSDPDWESFPYPFAYRLVGHARVTNGPTLPLNLAASINQYDDGLYRFCHAISHQFTRRYFNLLDLDFRAAARQSVKGLPTKLGSPNIILVLRTAPVGQDLPESFAPPDSYGTLES